MHAYYIIGFLNSQYTLNMCSELTVGGFKRVLNGFFRPHNTLLTPRKTCSASDLCVCRVGTPPAR